MYYGPRKAKACKVNARVAEGYILLRSVKPSGYYLHLYKLGFGGKEFIASIVVRCMRRARRVNSNCNNRNRY